MTVDYFCAVQMLSDGHIYWL